MQKRRRVKARLTAERVAAAAEKRAAADAEKARLTADRVAAAAEKRATANAEKARLTAAKEAATAQIVARAEAAHAAAVQAPRDMPRPMPAPRVLPDERPRSARGPRIKQVPFHVELMGGPHGRNETEAGDVTSMNKPRKLQLCWLALRILQEWVQKILSEWIQDGSDASSPPQVSVTMKMC